MVVGGGSQDPQCESPDAGILFKGGVMEAASSVASWILLMLVLANG